MSDTGIQGVGSITWVDLTVPDAAAIRDFYGEVVGWTATPVDMGGYSDFSMLPPAADVPAAGICFARGENAELPPQWLVYITVADVDASARRCADLGGEVIVGPKTLGGGRFCVIRDPAGAVAALYTPPAADQPPA
jgi:predicted enzyme related to lactoylglutathione lyase